jgi:hypothetical protein
MPTTSGGTQPIQIVCAPPAGSIFPIGITTVTCVATDANGVTARGSFTVTIRAPRIIVRRIITGLTGLVGTFKDAGDRAKLSAALDKLNAVAASPAWLDSGHLIRGSSKAVFDGERAAAKLLTELLARPLTATQRMALTDFLWRINASNRVLVFIALDEAPLRGVSAANIALAKAEFDKGDDNLAVGRFADAIRFLDVCNG